MLRYVFDTTAQLRRHVHPRDGAALLFFPESSQARRAGESVLLELQLREIGQQVVLRATIHSRVDGNVRGVWLQFGDLLSRTIEADAAALNRRRHPRVGSDLMVEVRVQNASGRIARIIDVSAGGARLGSAPRLAVGSTIDLQLLSSLPNVPRTIGRARVVRVSGAEVGLQFAPEAAAQVLKLMKAVQGTWTSAVTIQHPRNCCEAFAPVEPPLPRARPQRAIR